MSTKKKNNQKDLLSALEDAKTWLVPKSGRKPEEIEIQMCAKELDYIIKRLK